VVVSIKEKLGAIVPKGNILLGVLAMTLIVLYRSVYKVIRNLN